MAYESGDTLVVTHPVCTSIMGGWNEGQTKQQLVSNN